VRDNTIPRVLALVLLEPLLKKDSTKNIFLPCNEQDFWKRGGGKGRFI